MPGRKSSGRDATRRSRIHRPHMQGVHERGRQGRIDRVRQDEPAFTDLELNPIGRCGHLVLRCAGVLDRPVLARDRNCTNCRVGLLLRSRFHLHQPVGARAGTWSRILRVAAAPRWATSMRSTGWPATISPESRAMRQPNPDLRRLQLLAPAQWLKGSLWLLLAAVHHQPIKLEALIPLIAHGRGQVFPSFPCRLSAVPKVVPFATQFLPVAVSLTKLSYSEQIESDTENQLIEPTLFSRWHSSCFSYRDIYARST